MVVERQAAVAPRSRSAGGVRGTGDIPRRSILARLRRAGQRCQGTRDAGSFDHEYGFLLVGLIDEATLVRAERFAAEWGVAAHEVLIALGWVAEDDYVRALARHLGLEVAGDGVRLSRVASGDPALPKVVAGTLDGRHVVVIEARSFTPETLHALLARRGGESFALASRRTLNRERAREHAPAMLDHAVGGLLRRAPVYSARSSNRLWQPACLAALAGLALGGMAVAPGLAVGVLSIVLTAPFLCVVALRMAAAIEIVRSRSRNGETGQPPPGDPASLPLYTVMVALHREADVLADLVQALAALDYPAVRLQIVLVLEADDQETQRAAAALDLPGNFEIALVPKGGPRTKPKALNYALALVRGEFVVVYDAEDIPEPDQLRRALAVFRSSSRRLACVQARLNIYNAEASWLTRGIMAQTPRAA
jgi:hypothetical protein